MQSPVRRLLHQLRHDRYFYDNNNNHDEQFKKKRWKAVKLKRLNGLDNATLNKDGVYQRGIRLVKKDIKFSVGLMHVCVSQSVMFHALQPHELWPTRLLSPWDFPDKNIKVGCHVLLQGIFPTQRSNLDILHCRQILYSLGKPSVGFGEF